MTAVAPVMDAVIALDPEARTAEPRTSKSARVNSKSVFPAGTPVSVKLPEASDIADGPDGRTRTVTPERGISIPSARAPNLPLPRMTVPSTAAVPGEVGEDES